MRYGDIMRTCIQIATAATRALRGRALMDPFRRSTTFTIATAILKTTRSTISNVCPRLNISAITDGMRLASHASARCVAAISRRRIDATVSARPHVRQSGDGSTSSITSSGTARDAAPRLAPAALTRRAFVRGSVLALAPIGGLLSMPRATTAESASPLATAAPSGAARNVVSDPTEPKPKFYAYDSRADRLHVVDGNRYYRVRYVVSRDAS